MKKVTFFSLMFFFSELAISQEYLFNQVPLLFKEARTNDIVIIDNEKTIIKINKKIKIKIKLK